MVRRPLWRMEEKFQGISNYMQKYLVIIICVLLIIVGCDRTSKETETSNDESALKVYADSTYTYDQFKESITTAYVDSLNAFRKGTKLPSFLMNANFDVDSKINSWPNSNFVSAREEIFRKVKNPDVLIEIVENPYFKTQFEGIEKKRSKIPSDEVSNYTLAKERLQELGKQ